MRLFLLILLVMSSACTDVINIPTRPDPTTSNDTRPTPTPTPLPGVSRVEYRVSGNALGVRIRYSNAMDGLAQVITTLPYVATITTQESSLFLSLDATPTSYSYSTLYPFLAVQIFVNGNLFREATSNEFLLNTLSVSGTWRR